jgi:hypothetical protein
MELLLRRNEELKEVEIKCRNYLGLIEDLQRRNGELVSGSEKYRGSQIAM